MGQLLSPVWHQTDIVLFKALRAAKPAGAGVVKVLVHGVRILGSGCDYFQVTIPPGYEAEAMRQRMSDGDLADLALLGLPLLDAISRHLQQPGAEVRLHADETAIGFLDVAPIQAQMRD